MVDLLENISIEPNDLTFAGLSKQEVQTRPLFPKNIQNWQEIDCTTLVENIDGKDIVFGMEVVQLKNNKIPKWLVVLETLFDSHDIYKVENKEYTTKDLEEVNI